MSVLEDLKRRRDLVEATLRDVRKPLRLEEDRARKRRKRNEESDATWKGKLRDVQLCLCALWLVGWSFADALTVLDHLQRPPNWAEKSHPERQTILENLFLSTDLELVESWADVALQENLPRMTVLWQAWAEWQTALWVGTVNMKKGVAPSSISVFTCFTDKLNAAPPEVQNLCSFKESHEAKLKWAMRWRRRWDACIGKLQVGDVDPPDVLLDKVVWGTPRGPF